MSSDTLAAVQVAPEVFELRPDYRVGLLEVRGIEPAASDAASEALLDRAQAFATELLSQTAVEDVPHIAAWREAYRRFGAKPQRTRNSLEALVRRAVDGLPRVNRLTDIYNAMSVLHLVPLGGEDLDHYSGAAHLVRAVGDESFDTPIDGQIVIEHPEPGEVVWRDDAGVTCRRWNWRQGVRTRLTDGTTSALFILDALEPMDDLALTSALDDIAGRLTELGRSVTVERRIIGAGS